MKLTICLVAAVTLFCGCNQKPVPSIAKLEAQNAEMSARLDSLERLVSTNYTLLRDVGEMASLTQGTAEDLLKMSAIDGKRIGALETNVFHLK